jgi:Patatin-like phospholipase
MSGVAMAIGTTYHFHEVFQEEIDAINERRRSLGRTNRVRLEVEVEADNDREPIMRPTARSNLVGLALSGGGIRSASFCLGALQALDKADVLKNIDYLSTVSGGGYIGTSMSAAMTCSKGEFPFKSSLTQDEPYPIQHVRNHSNYLFPRGSINILYNVAIYLRGILANGLLILPWLLLAASVTIFVKPNAKSLHISNVLGRNLPDAFSTDHFVLTLAALCAFGMLLLVWGLWRSLELSGWAAEIGSPWTRVSALALIAVLIIAFCELQPLILDGIFESAKQQDDFAAHFVAWLKRIAAVLAPFSAAVAFFSRYIGLLLKKGGERPSRGAAAMRILGKAAVYVAGAAIPFLLWLAYLYLAFLGINDGSGYHISGWVTGFAQRLFHSLPAGDSVPIAWFYLAMFVILSPASLILSANANSLHRLYRDRLSKAFLFDPTIIEGQFPGSRRQISTSMNIPMADELLKYENFELAPIDRFKLSKVSWEHTPYHLINTALNIQGSKYANRRGRNADFFFFSPKFTGSGATRYVRTEEFEQEVDELDLATAMAVSGAAASSNMGANSIKALTPTLAILNVRLGYWLANPSQLANQSKPPSALDQLYFLQELLGLMREDSGTVYLTDGGHIENLGIYELLRRRCKVIVAVDAEADEAMHFPSLITLQRYARIDLGIRIDLPWEPIATATIAEMQHDPEHPRPPSCGPHVAVGTIDYGGGEVGYLIYIKSSLTGDENDYIRDYARRYSSFPHEITLDQLFSEEQFEAYRALGFHMVHGFLSAHDRVCVNEVSPSGDTTVKLKKFNDTSNPILADVYQRLFPANHVSGRTPN